MIAAFDRWLCHQPWFAPDAHSVDLCRGYLSSDDLYIEAIQVHSNMRGKGIGRAILVKLIELADAHDLVLALEASQDSPDAHWLQDWYGRYDFIYSEDGQGDFGPYMIRSPKNAGHTS